MKPRKQADISIEVNLPEINEEQLDSLLDFLAELLATERIRELEESEDAS